MCEPDVDNRASETRLAVGCRNLPLREYERLKLDLAGLIHAAMTCAADEHNDTLRWNYQDLAASLAQDRFHLAVVGQSSRGKSTLMNAVLGMDRLPTGIVPITSVITSVSYGSRERVRFYFQDSNLYHEGALSELAEYITEQGNPGNQRRIEIAEVQLPAEVLQRGFLFVDTPGFGSVIAENTATARRFFPKAEAFLFVTSFDSPFSAEEMGFLREACSRQRKVFFIVNKIDLVTKQQGEEVLSFIRSRLLEQADPGQIEIFALSAREALASKLNHDSVRLEGSGLPVLETALVNFITTDKLRELLAQTYHRFEALLADQMNPRLGVVKQRLAELGTQILGERAAAAPVGSVKWETSEGALVAPQACPVCGSINRDVFNFVSRYQYELSRNLDEQDSHAARNGFCALHTWQYAKLASPQGICTAYPKLLFSLAKRLRGAWEESVSDIAFLEAVTGMLSRPSRCVICEVTRTAEKRVIGQIVTALLNRLPKVHQTTAWLCLPHVALTLQAMPSDEERLPLVQQMSVALDRSAENMQRYALKHEGLRKELVSDEEWQSPEFGLALVVGDRRVQFSLDQEAH